jgi:aminoglycoside phosphotransferase
VRRLGIADPYQGRAFLWNCLEEFGADLQQELLNAYGISSSDERGLSFRLCLDECF